MCGQEGQPNHRLILLLLKLHISRLGECPIAQGCRNLPRTILKTQQLCTFLLYKNIPSYVWKYWLGKGGVATSNPSSSCCKIKSCAPSSPRDTEWTVFVEPKGYPGILRTSYWVPGSNPHSTSSYRHKLLTPFSSVKAGYILIMVVHQIPNWLWHS